MSQTANTAIAVIGIDIGKTSFPVLGPDARGAIVLRQKWSRGQVEARLANVQALPDRHGSQRRRTSYLEYQRRHYRSPKRTSCDASLRVQANTCARS